MTTPTLQSVLQRAATDPAFRARLLADPALGLTEDKLQALLVNPDLAQAELSLEMLDLIAGGPMSINRSGGNGDPDLGMPALDAASS